MSGRAVTLPCMFIELSPLKHFYIMDACQGQYLGIYSKK